MWGQGEGPGGRSPHDSVELAAVELALPARERKHRGVAIGVVVREREARLDRVLRVGGRELAVLALGEPARVAARNVPNKMKRELEVRACGSCGATSGVVAPGASDVAHDEYV